MKLTITQFRERFPDNNACLNHLFTLKYEGYDICPKCGENFNYDRVKGRTAYQCSRCSNQVYPTAGTVFHQTTTPLTYWFYAIYLYTTTRNGVAAKELERQLDVCYKTALRMAHQIKKLMTDSDIGKLSGEIMVDETYFGMLSKNMHNEDREQKKIRRGKSSKVGIMGIMQKDGRVITKLIKPSEGARETLREILESHVTSESTVVTDGFSPYQHLNKSFKKHVVVDHAKEEYVKDGYSTNGVENYWSTLKRMLKGTHIHVSNKHLPKYLDENTFRYVNRSQPEKMLDLILQNVFLLPASPS